MRLPRPVLVSILVPVLAGLTFGLAGVSPATAAYPSHAGADPHGRNSSILQLVGALLPELGKSHSTRVAAQALANAQQVLAPKTTRSAPQLPSADGDATMTLASLAAHRDELSASDKKAAARILARPKAGARVCSRVARICVHYRTSGASRSTKTWATRVLSVVSHVARVYSSSGYRRPVGDGATGGFHNYVDVYLSDLGPQKLYGYCTPGLGTYVASGYCVFDNDFAHRQFPTDHTPLQDLKVTAAHEFFHVVQWAYDANVVEGDLWLAETTAAWAEDELYSGINDNRQYLPLGQLRHPRTPLDKQTPTSYYGNWIFFRYVTEQMPHKKGALPSIILQIWRRMALSPHHHPSSARAITRALAARGRSIKGMYARFAAANLHPRSSYSEGAHYPAAKVAGVTTLRPAKKRASGHYTVSHLASATERFKPRHVSRRRHLRVNAHLGRKRFQVAIVTVYRKHETLTHLLRLNAKGNGHITVAFDNARVTRVDLTLVNTAHVYRCNQGTAYACHGTPIVDKLKDTWSARLV